MAYVRQEHDPGSGINHLAVSLLCLRPPIQTGAYWHARLAGIAMGITAKILATQIYGAPLFIALTCAWVSALAPNWDYRTSCLLTKTDFVQLSCHLAADAVITSTIGVCLWRSKTGWKQTDALVIQLLVMTAETLIPPTIL